MPHTSMIKKLLNRGLTAPTVAVTSFLVVCCGDSFMKQKVTNEAKGSFELAATADAAGNYTGAIDPSSTSTQVLRATSGGLAGSAIALPPGSLGINLNITIGSGETLASSDTTQQLGLGDNTASAAGPSVSFVPSQNVQATNPFTLSIPVSGTSLTGLGLALANADNDNLVVMYKWIKVTDGVTSYAIGIITRDQLTIGSKTVQFQTDKFGTFQLAVTQTKITQPITKPTTEPPVLKADAGNPLVGVWSQCYGNDGGGYTNSASPSPTATPPTRADIEAKLNQQVVDFDAAQSAKTMSSACESTSPSTQPKPKFNVRLSNGQNPSTVGLTPHKVSTGNTDSIQSPVTLTYTDGVPMTANLYISTSAGEKLYFDLNTSGCHFGSLPDMKRIYVNECQPSTPIDIYCDGTTMTDAIDYAFANATASANSNTTTTSGSGGGSGGGDGGGGGRDHLGIPPDTANLSSREYVKFSASTFIHSRSTFAAANCTGAMLNRTEETGTYKVGTANADGVMSISISFAAITGTILTGSNVTYANQNPTAAGCGFNDWSLGNPKDLANSTCGNKKNSGPSIVRIKDSNIFFDDGGSGTINTKDFMTRQP